MNNVNELYRTEAQVKAMSEEQLVNCLSEIDLYFSNLATSPSYDDYIANVKTFSSLENKEFSALNATRYMIVSRLVHWFNRPAPRFYPSLLTAKELKQVLDNFEFPSPIITASNWKHERQKSMLDIQLETGRVILSVEHILNKIIKVFCVDQQQNLIGQFKGQLTDKHAACCRVWI